jgi:uncharacterized membrane protein
MPGIKVQISNIAESSKLGVCSGGLWSGEIGLSFGFWNLTLCDGAWR